MDLPNERTFVGCEGFDIFCRYWKPLLLPDQSPSALVFMCHGLFEYAGTDEFLVDSLVKAGFFVFGHDHAGHGKSGGDPGQVRSLENYARDVLTHVGQVKERIPDRPVFLLGHSMGGAIALLVGLQQPQLFRGMILIGPLVIGNADVATPTKKFLAKFLSKILPHLGIQNINNDDLSHDTAVVSRFNTDPLIYRGKMTLQTAHALLEAVDKISANFSNIRWPFLCIHGGDDKICDVQGAQDLLDKSSSSDKTLVIHPGAYHRVQDEPDGVREKCVSAVVSWISDRLA